MVAHISGCGSVTRGTPRPTNLMLFQVERLPPHQQVDIGMMTSTKPWEDTGFSPDSGLLSVVDDRKYLRHYMNGSFQFPYQGATLTRNFFAGITYDKESRNMAFGEVKESKGEQKVLRAVIMT